MQEQRSPTPRRGSAPSDWPNEDLVRHLNFQNPAARGQLPKSAEGTKGIIASTSEPLAIHAGLEALKHGGSAADAALTTSLAQIALSAGSAYSYAGIMTAVYYDASTAKVYTL